MEEGSVIKAVKKRIEHLEAHMGLTRIGTPNHEGLRKERKALILALHDKDPFKIERVKIITIKGGERVKCNTCGKEFHR